LGLNKEKVNYAKSMIKEGQTAMSRVIASVSVGESKLSAEAAFNAFELDYKNIISTNPCMMDYSNVSDTNESLLAAAYLCTEIEALGDKEVNKILNIVSNLNE